jgi:proton-dependent oligopeptide transporter, POT family
MSDTAATQNPASQEKTLLGHPPQLALLFATEMWERFGYYGMRALLILYLVHHFFFADRVAGGLYGAFTALVYLMPLAGGFIADQYLGHKRAVKLGALLMSIGYLTLAFTGGEPAKPYIEIGQHRYDAQMVGSGENASEYLVDHGARYKIVGNEDRSISLEGAKGALPAKVAAGGYKFDGERAPTNVVLLFLSLALVIIGNGYFKPNISTIVGTLYAQGDRRRDAGFTIFYMGINLGSMLSQILAPWVAAIYGFTWGFALAGFGMLFAFLLFQIFGSSVLKGYGDAQEGAKRREGRIGVLSLLAVPVVWFLLDNAMTAASAAHQAGSTGIVAYLAAQPLLGQLMVGLYVIAMIGLPVWSLATLPAVERNRMIVAIVLTSFSVVFWTLNEQAGSSMTLFADRNTDLVMRHLPLIGSFTVQAGQVQVFNPVFIVIFAPLLSLLWNWLGARRMEPSIPLKFALGLALQGLAYLVLVYGAKFHDIDFRVSLTWLGLSYFLGAIGELCLSPVGLSMITKLSVEKIVGMMMGVWFLSTAMAEYAAGMVAQLASSETVGGKVLNPEVSLSTYVGVFHTIGIAGIAAGAVLLLLWPLLKKGMHGVS